MSGGILGGNVHPGGAWALAQAPQGHGDSSKPGTKCPVQGQELGSVILMGPFQLRMACDSLLNRALFASASKNSKRLKTSDHYFCPFQNSVKIVFTTCKRKALPCSPW